MNKWLIAGATAAGLVISSAAMARVDVGISIGVPGVVYPAAPVYVAPPPPVYVAPAPVYAPPPPVYYRPAPVYVAPPVIYPAPVYYAAAAATGTIVAATTVTAIGARSRPPPLIRRAASKSHSFEWLFEQGGNAARELMRRVSGRCPVARR